MRSLEKTTGSSMKNEYAPMVKARQAAVGTGQNLPNDAYTHKPQVAPTLFDNLPELLPPGRVAELLSLKPSTVYDWKARPKRAGVPPDLFVKFGNRLYVRRDA